MLDKFEAVNEVDKNNNPAGGYVKGKGLEIRWQDGPLGHGPIRSAPNGAFVETVIAAVIQRIEFYQEANLSKFFCSENVLAINKLKEAIHFLNRRTHDRETRDVEGTTAP